MFFIYAFSNPYSPPGALDPNALQHLLDGEIGSALRGKMVGDDRLELPTLSV